MVKDILNALIKSADRINFTVLLPQALDQLKGNDASFETASSSSIQTVKLYYVKDVVTKSLGIVFYHNFILYGKLSDRLQNEYDVVVPSTKMLKTALGLDRVHTRGDISMSQLLETMDWVIENATIEGQKIANGQKVLFLVAIISPYFSGLLAESEQEHTE